jgi:MFS family permease
VNFKVMPPLDAINAGLSSLSAGRVDAHALAQSWATSYRQVNPEYIVNLDFGAIVLLQIGMSAYLQRWKALPILVAGTLLLSLGLWIAGFSHAVALGGFCAVGAVLVFSFGEMVASPKSQEYVAAITPPGKTAMFMGYYFVAMALGNLFGGLLSGWAYGTLAKQWQRPAWMWVLFAAIGALTALCLLLFHLKQQAGSTVQAQPAYE